MQVGLSIKINTPCCEAYIESAGRRRREVVFTKESVHAICCIRVDAKMQGSRRPSIRVKDKGHDKSLRQWARGSSEGTMLAIDSNAVSIIPHGYVEIIF